MLYGRPTLGRSHHYHESSRRNCRRHIESVAVKPDKTYFWIAASLRVLPTSLEVSRWHGGDRESDGFGTFAALPELLTNFDCQRSRNPRSIDF